MTGLCRHLLLGCAAMAVWWLPCQPANAADPAPAVQAAPPIGAETAANVQIAVQNWLNGLLGPAAAGPRQAFALQPDGDHYRLRLNLAAAPGVVLTGQARPMAGGAWQIGDILLPERIFLFSRSLGPGRRSVIQGMSLHIGAQAARLRLDPSLATASVFEGEYQNIDLLWRGDGPPRRQHIDRYDVKTSLLPAEPGRLNLMQILDIQGLHNSRMLADGTQISASVARLHVAGHLDGLNRAQMPPLLRALGEIFSSRAPPPPDQFQAQLHALVLALRDAVRAGQLAQSADGILLESGGSSLAIDHAELELSAQTTAGTAPGVADADGFVAVQLELAASGLTMPNIGVALAPFLPQHVVLRPFIGPVDLHDLTALALAATLAPPRPAADLPEYAAIFAHGGVATGLESFDFDLGPAQFSGNLHLAITGPGQIGGHADIMASGFDALIAKVSAAAKPAAGPEEANPVARLLPLLVIMKGLGRADGDQLAWRLVWRGGHVLVNGTDLSALVPHG